MICRYDDAQRAEAPAPMSAPGKRAARPDKQGLEAFARCRELIRSGDRDPGTLACYTGLDRAVIADLLARTRSVVYPQRYQDCPLARRADRDGPLPPRPAAALFAGEGHYCITAAPRNRAPTRAP